MILGRPLPSRAAWTDTDSDTYNDTWTDPNTSIATALVDLNTQNVDADNDGATNDEEAAEGSDPFNYDSDYDGISDGDELHIVKPLLGVSLTNWDSDNDEVSDYDEWYNFSGVTYPGGVLPNFPGASYSDYDGDGLKNPVDSAPTTPYDPGTADTDGDNLIDSFDPFPSDPTNYSSFNGIAWGSAVLSDSDNDTILNWQDLEPYGPPDTDADGIPDAQDPYPSDASNYSDLNYVYWYGGAVNDYDGDGTPNWQDGEPYGPLSDADGDSIPNSIDPFANDSSNYSSINSIVWYGDVFGDADSDLVLNWEDSDPYNDLRDSDADGIPNNTDPYPSDISNYSSINNVTWNSDVLGDADSDGAPNWQDSDPWPPADGDGDGLTDHLDPYPLDYTNYSSLNGIAWADAVLGDSDSDMVANWADAWPYDPYNDTPPDPDNDDDGLTASTESTYGTSDADIDCDDDGLSDYEELIVYSTNPLNAYHLSQALGWGELYNDYQLIDATDTDADDIPDRIEQHYGMLPSDPADGAGDLDGNGMTNVVQYSAGLALNIDLNLYDGDGDGMTNIFEDHYGLNKNSFADAMGDADSDGVLNFEESRLLSSPLETDTYGSGPLGDLAVLMTAMLDPEGDEPVADADGDDIADWMEIRLVGTSPRFTRVATNDLDGDGMPDVWEHQHGRWKYPTMGLYVRHNDADSDADGDSLPNVREHQLGANPVIMDTNQNGVQDGEEDFDGDGLSNGQEMQFGSSPLLADTDGDQFDDLEEYLTGSDVLSGQSTPLNPDSASEPSPTPLPPQPRPILSVPVRNTAEFPLSTMGETLRAPATYVMEAAQAYGYFASTLNVTYDEWGLEVSRETFNEGYIYGTVGGEATTETYESLGSWSGGFDTFTTDTNFVPFGSGTNIFMFPTGYMRSVDEDDVVWSESWAKDQARFKVRWAGEEEPELKSDVWWLVHRHREHWDEDENDYVVDGILTSIEPYVISIEPEVKTLTSEYWIDGSLETVTATMIHPEILTVNNGDVDSDGRPNFADSLEETLEEGEVAFDGEFGFFAVQTEAWQGAKFRLTYAASPPQGVTSHTSPTGETRYLPAPGGLRVWMATATSRDPRSVIEDGSYVPPDVWISKADVGEVDLNTWQFYVESVRVSEEPYDHQILIEVDMDGDGPKPPYVLNKKFYTSVSTTLHAVTAGGVGGNTEHLRPSLPNPTIEIEDFQVNNPRVAQDGSLLADITVTGKVRSAVCDLTEGAATGAIKSAFASINGKVHGQSVAALQIQKSSAGGVGIRPHPYEGTLVHTMTDVPVTEGWNRFVVGVQDPIYHLSGTASVGFEMEATPPPAYGAETAVAVQLPAAGVPLQEQEARVTLLDGGVTLLDNVLLYRVPSDEAVASYHSVPGAARRLVLYFPERPELDPGDQETATAVLTVYEPGGSVISQQLPFGRMAESGAATGLFFWSATSTFAPYLGWSVEVGEVGEPEATGPGEFHPVAIRLDGPQAIVSKVAQMHFAGQALPVVSQGGVTYAANPENPGQPAVFVSLPIPSVEVPQVPPYVPDSGAEEEDWELKEDVPEEQVEDVVEDLSAHRSILSQANADELIERVTRLAVTAGSDQLTVAYYKGFATGFFDNPISSGKDAVSSICGLVPKAINVATLANPLRIVWEFTGGDRYQSEIAVAKKAVRAGMKAVDLVKEFAPETLDFLWNLSNQSVTHLEIWRLTGKLPGEELMGPELHTALEVVVTLLILGDDNWNGMGAYERGYYQGYITFEVALTVVAAALTAEAGGTGAAATMSRHAPKLLTMLKHVEKILAKLQDVPALGRLLLKVRAYILTAGKLPAFCFVKGTPVLTAQGMKSIEQVQAMDWVWSRSEDGCEWDWRPVLGTVVTHPEALAHVSYRVSSEANAVRGPPLGASTNALPAGMLIGLPEAGEISGSLEHPFHVQREGDCFAGFVPLRDMRVGDVLTLADGRAAVVEEHRVEQAVSGTVFTTYNFEVAEYHTYFAGALPVWVHNKGDKDCESLLNKLLEIISLRGDDVAKYFEYLVEARDKMDPRAGQLLKKVLPDKVWSNAAKKISKLMSDKVASGEISWQAIPSVKDFDVKFFKRPWPDFKYGNDPRGFPDEMLRRGGVNIHHVVPKYVQRLLEQAFPGKMPSHPDLSPGHVLSLDDHKALHAAMKLVIPEGSGSVAPEDAAGLLVQFYRDNNQVGLAKIVEGWFQSIDIPVSPP
jgi:hypothetical protein